tara:strand:+ start:370 stop:807 length:438 start_codon:yes stop_codon:yes gene_type:complete
MTTAQSFPDIKPSSRQFNPGQYPSTNFEALDGTKTHIRYGNRRVNATLTLGFSNITDGQVGLILDNYDDVMSVYDYVKFTDANGSAGIEGAGSGYFLRKEIHDDAGTGKTRLGLKWRYSAPPTVTSVYPGISNVSCSFVACLDAP